MYLVGIKPVVVHGGGHKITEMLDALKIDTEFIEGQRVTTKEVMRIVEMILSGEINKDIVSLLNSLTSTDRTLSSRFITYNIFTLSRLTRPANCSSFACSSILSGCHYIV